jgi:hypothetical protein
MSDQETAELDLAGLLAAPPRRVEDGEGGDGFEYALIELSLTFPKLNVVPERLALWLRIFIVTQDPLSWIANREHVWTSASSDGRVLEVDLYLDLYEVLRSREAAGGDLAAALGRYGETAMRAIFANEESIADGGEIPALLAGLDDYEAGWGVPAVSVRSDGWEDIGLGARQDLVAHVAAARAVQLERFARARASNPAGWRAIDKAAARITREPEPIFAPQPKRTVQSISRNDPCPCGSGRKYKRCHGA